MNFSDYMTNKLSFHSMFALHKVPNKYLTIK